MGLAPVWTLEKKKEKKKGITEITNQNHKITNQNQES